MLILNHVAKEQLLRRIIQLVFISVPIGKDGSIQISNIIQTINRSYRTLHNFL
jgi:hypothetical protein